MEKNGLKQEFTCDQAGVTSKVTIKNTDVPLTEKKVERRKASDLSQNEVAEMVFDMTINHRIMEMRLEKAENRINALTSLMMQKGFNIP